MRREVALVTLAALILSGCMSGGTRTAVPELQPNQYAAPAPTVTGEAVEGIVGGGLVGSAFGVQLGRGERRSALEAEYRALESTPAGQAVTWEGSFSGRSGKVVAAQPYRVGSQDCRQYTHTITSGGVEQTARGTACRNPDGSWTVLS
ncbi:hypothetical protein [Mesorhizobium sp. J18]|uniref:hypothetical protein n=1 Tax=Mesorhizobium sp. J18 TaxID=935263 RepID=UPI001FEE9842|nr:hypothetical protein [Mesorhizobium sp. J18]